MAILSQVEDLVTGAVLHSFLPAASPVGEQGWEHRNATFTIANLNFGSSPWGNNAAPFAPRRWPWEVRVVGLRGYDAAHDALALAVGAGWPVRLVQTTDQGYTRVCNGVAYKVGAPFDDSSTFSYAFRVEWELLAPWTERNPVNGALRSGQGFRSGQTAPALRSGQGNLAVTITSASFAIPTNLTDASFAGPGGAPTLADTGPIFTFTGPVGGAAGFLVGSATDRFGAFFGYSAPLLAGQQLVIDCGAWSATLTQNGVKTDVTALLSVPTTQPYIMAISPPVANALTVACLGASPTTGGTVAVQWRRYFI